ncbi:MAG: hypothetical protein N6V49_14475, partial [Serratia symbiotica]|nr:hypothetical protein [Serratia symbiotica]
PTNKSACPGPPLVDVHVRSSSESAFDGCLLPFQLINVAHHHHHHHHHHHSTITETTIPDDTTLGLVGGAGVATT